MEYCHDRNIQWKVVGIASMHANTLSQQLFMFRPDAQAKGPGDQVEKLAAAEKENLSYQTWSLPQ